MIEQKISDAMQKLPLSVQQELPDSVDFMLIKAERQEAREWNMLSLSSALRDMESEEEPIYALEDLKVTFR